MDTIHFNWLTLLFFFPVNLVVSVLNVDKKQTALIKYWTSTFFDKDVTYATLHTFSNITIEQPLICNSGEGYET